MGPLYVQEEFLGEESLGAKYMGEKPQKYPALSTQQNTQLGVFLSTSLGFWDIGQHGTTIKWKTISIPPKKIPSCPKIPSSVDTSLFVDIPWLLGHGTAWDQWKTTRK